LHDLLANPLGYERGSELAMGDLRLRWQEEKLFLERFDLLRIRSLAPTETWFPRVAWSFRAAFDRAREMDCRAWHCSEGLLEGGGGLSAQVGPALVFSLVELSAEAGAPFHPHYRLSAGPSGGILLPLWPGGRALVEGRWHLRLAGEKRQKRSARFGLNQDWGKRTELRAEGAVDRDYREILLRWSRYF
jgi:hypothetical protein